MLVSRSVIAALALVAVACGKHTVDPPQERGTALNVESAPPVDSTTQSAPSAPEKDDAPEPVPPSPLATSCSGVSLVIASVTPTEHGLDAVVELRNASHEHVPLMLSGDGSVKGRRNPSVTFELSPNDVESVGGCGNMNSLSPTEIAFLAPGTRTKLDWLYAPTPAKSGRYTLRATYVNDPESNQLGDNRPGPKTDRLVARVRKTLPCTLVSNTVAFTYKR